MRHLGRSVLFGVLVTLNQRVGRVIVDGLEVLGFDGVGRDPVVGIQTRRYVTHHVLDELRVVVGALGHVLLVGALQDAVQLAGGFALGNADDFLNLQV